MLQIQATRAPPRDAQHLRSSPAVPQTAPTHGADRDPSLCPGELMGGLDTHVQTCPVYIKSHLTIPLAFQIDKKLGCLG